MMLLKRVRTSPIATSAIPAVFQLNELKVSSGSAGRGRFGFLAHSPPFLLPWAPASSQPLRRELAIVTPPDPDTQFWACLSQHLGRAEGWEAESTPLGVSSGTYNASLISIPVQFWLLLTLLLPDHKVSPKPMLGPHILNELHTTGADANTNGESEQFCKPFVLWTPILMSALE